MPAGEGSGVVVRSPVEAHQPEQFERALPSSASPAAGTGSRRAGIVLAGMRRRAHEHVLEDGHARQRSRRLERPHEAAPRDCVRRPAVDPLAGERHAAAVGAHEPGDDVEERRLAGAVRADQGRDGAGLDRERRGVDGATPP